MHFLESYLWKWNKFVEWNNFLLYFYSFIAWEYLVPLKKFHEVEIIILSLLDSVFRLCYSDGPAQNYLENWLKTQIHQPHHTSTSFWDIPRWFWYKLQCKQVAEDNSNINWSLKTTALSIVDISECKVDLLSKAVRKIPHTPPHLAILYFVNNGSLFFYLKKKSLYFCHFMFRSV